MRVVRLMSASSRRTVVMLGFAALCAASVASAQDAAPAAPAAPAAQPAPQEDPLKFSSEAAFVVWQIKPEGAADFERVFGVMKSRMTASDNMELKAAGDSMMLYKPLAAAAPGQPVTYFVRIDPASKTVSYDPRFIFYMAKKADGMTSLFERPEADELYNLLGQAVMGINAIPMAVVH